MVAVKLVAAEWPRARFVLRESAAYVPMLVAMLVARREPFVVSSAGPEVSIDLMERHFDPEPIAKAFNACGAGVAGRVELVERCFVFARRRPPRDPDCSQLDFAPVVNALRRPTS